MDHKLNLSEKIRNIRLSQGKNQKDFAESLGVSQSYYSNVENGNMDPSTILLKNLVNVYAINLNWLLTEEAESQKEEDKISGTNVISISGSINSSNVQIGDRVEKKYNRIYHPLPPGSISADHAVEIQEYVKKIIHAAKLANYYPPQTQDAVYSAFKKKFRVPSYRELPEMLYPEAVRYFQKKLAIINRKGYHSRNKSSFVNKYIQNIHVIYKNELKWTEEEYRKFLRENYQVDSSLDMKDEQIFALYHQLNRMKSKKEE
jgi:transcriptional regulator with XRE-family HTH domain